MELSAIKNNRNTPNKSRKADDKENLHWSIPEEEEDQHQNEEKPNETNDNNDPLPPSDNEIPNENECEHARLPLLSPEDRKQSSSPRKNFQLSPFRKSREFIVEEVKELDFKSDKVELISKSPNQDSKNNGTRNRYPKTDQQSVPLLGTSAAPRVGFYPENIEKIEDAQRNEADKNYEIGIYEKVLNVNINDNQIKEAPPSPRYSGYRRKGTWEALANRAKGDRKKSPKELKPELARHRKWKFLNKVVPESKKELSRSELFKSYRLHIFVCIIFIITVLSVSLSWYFKNEAKEKLYSSQAIFFNPRTRELTLSDSSKSNTIRGVLGLDIPRWILPLHCPIVMGDDPHHKECLWKRNAVLRINHFEHENIQCYNVSWESLGAMYAPHDCMYLDKAKWYGPSNQSENTFPIQGQFEYSPLTYTLNNNGVFNKVVDFYWLSSNGVAVYVDPNNPIQLTWNISGNNQLCFKSNFSGPLYHKTNSINHPVINYTLCQGTDMLKTHQYMQKMFAPKSSVHQPPDSMFKVPHWSLKSLMKTENVTQDSINEVLDTISANNFTESVITIDGNWQKSQGDLIFDEIRFPNISQLMDRLNSSGSLLTLSINPYFHYMSPNFHTGVTTDLFAKDAGGEITGLTKFEGELAAILDVFKESARRWFSEKLPTLPGMSYRLTYGQHSWLPYKPHFYDADATPNMYRKLLTELLGTISNSSLIVEHTSDSRHLASLIPVTTKLSQNGKCLTNVIETALTLGLLGYPYVMADGIKTGTNTLSRELYIRWLQLAHLFPAYQYSIAPWEYDQDVVSRALKLSDLRHRRVLPEIKSVQHEATNGVPILRPVWWINSNNRSAHDLNIKDQFLIGNNLLVAPVVCEGTKERDVFIPSGIWENVDTNSIVLGPNVITIYNLTIENVVIYQKR